MKYVMACGLVENTTLPHLKALSASMHIRLEIF
jgi:hypothetical protein